MNLQKLVVALWCSILVPAAAACCLVLLPTVSAAQTGSALTGVVRDISGAVLPGVTIEASSPALIEGARLAVSDAQGVYRIVDLRPGTYRVSFTLPGFKALVRDGVVLTSAFTATVNADLEVGALEETVTVTGQAPVVDTQNTAAREVFTRDVVEALPIAKTTGVWAALIPAMRQPPPAAADSGATGGVDVGATQSERSQAEVTVHGGANDIRVVRDGMEAMRGVYSMNRVDTQEITVQMGGNPAEAETGGVRINIVPREGGNVFSGTFEFDGTTEDLQGSNIDDELRARGVVGTPYVKQAYNVGGSVGGPILQDRLWFFGSYRKWGSQLWLPGKYYNATQGTPVYTADLSRPASSNDYYQSFTGRATWAATRNQKFNFTFEHANNCNCVIRLIALNRAPEATGDHLYFHRIPQVSWQYAASNRLLFESGFAWYHGMGDSEPVEGVEPQHIAIRELSTDFRWNARADNIGGSGAYAHRSMRNNLSQRLNVSYVTGSHNFKTGVWVQQWPNFNEWSVNGGMLQNFRNGVPTSVTLYASPLYNKTMAHNIGLYTQDQWTMRRLTLNVGLRYDTYRGYAPEVRMPAGPFVPERTFAKTDDLVTLNDLNPRIGAAYDLFGNSRTAVKGFLGRFIVGEAGDLPAQPAMAIVSSANRTWADRNGDFVPQESELGPLSNNQFGNPQPVALTVGDDVRYGWGNRAYTWQGILSIDHEVVPGLGVQLAYYRTWWGNQNFIDNQLVTAADFDEYCITAPVDSRLPSDVSGSQICGLYDIKPAKYGQVQNSQQLAGDLRRRVFNGIDVNVSGRFGNGGTIGGGIAFGDTDIDDCGAAVDNPAQGLSGIVPLRFCRSLYGWSEDVQFKINGSYLLPWDLRVSYVFQSLPGFPISAVYVVTSAMAAPSLGRNFSAGANATVEVELIEPNTEYEERTNILDLRFSRRFRVGGTSINGLVDVSNALNANTPQYVNPQYGPQWLNVTNAMSARVVRLGVQIGF
jgi:hypothetical protein